MLRFNNSLFIIVATLLLFAHESFAADIVVQDPSRDGVEVRNTYMVSGTASIPSGLISGYWHGEKISRAFGGLKVRGKLIR